MIDAAVLPAAWAMQASLHLGWAVVLAWLLVAGVRLCSAQPLSQRMRWCAAVLAVVALLASVLPGSGSLSYYLGLAFQAPSVMSILLCGMALWRWLRPSASAPTGVSAQRIEHVVQLSAALVGVLLGWYLLLDTLALLPVSVYAWGYGRTALWAVLVVVLLWAMAIHSLIRARSVRFVWPILAVLLVFATTRLSTGNLWDALLDPWLWLASHLWVLIAFRRWLRGSRPTVYTKIQ